MQRANDSKNQTIEQMRQTIQTLAQRVNQLERLLDGKEIREAKVDEGTVYQRGTKLSLSNGMISPAWNATEISHVSNPIDYDAIFVGGNKYTPGAKTTDFLQIGADGSSSWVAGPIPNVMPTGYEIYDVTKNHIHITGATAGNI